MALAISGGSFTTSDGTDLYVVCLNTGDLTVTGSGTVNYLIIGGGGAGGSSHGGGGGAGEVISGTFSATPGIYSAVVGLGGSIGETTGGSSSIFNTTAIGGGRGGGASNGDATGGGSGGGGSGYNNSPTGASSTISNGGLGNAGGNGFLIEQQPSGGGGGGGSGSIGGNAPESPSSNAPGGSGGSGTPFYSGWISAIRSQILSSDWLTATASGVIASGGAGGSWGTVTVVAGPPGGGGSGGTANNDAEVIQPTVGIANTGSGGGGGGSGGQFGASGGSGIIILRYSFSLSPSSASIFTGITYSSLYTINSANVTSYSLNPFPTSGLIFNTENGNLGGIPDNIYESTTSYTITATYDDGLQSSQPFELTINCFLKGSKILTDKGYIAIEDLRKGDLVKTYLNDYKPILMIGKSLINHNANMNRIKDQLYKFSKEVYAELTEDLIISGGHSILVEDFETEEQKSENMKYFGEELPKVDGLYRLLTCVNEKALPYKEKGTFEIYHLALENQELDKAYGIYANGLLVESCSINHFTERGGLELLE